MLTMFQVEKLVETFTKKPKTPKRKLQRSPKIIGYEREANEPLLSYEEDDDIDCDHRGEIVNKGVDNNNKNSNVRVKVLLTKEEAAKLLAKCKEKGVLEFKDVVMELGKLPTQRINVVSVAKFATQSKDLELATIVEEEEEEEEEDKEYYKKNN